MRRVTVARLQLPWKYNNTKSKESRTWVDEGVTGVACVIWACFEEGAAEGRARVKRREIRWGTCESLTRQRGRDGGTARQQEGEGMAMKASLLAVRGTSWAVQW